MEVRCCIVMSMYVFGCVWCSDMGGKHCVCVCVQLKYCILCVMLFNLVVC